MGKEFLNFQSIYRCNEYHIDFSEDKIKITILNKIEQLRETNFHNDNIFSYSIMDWIDVLNKNLFIVLLKNLSFFYHY